MHKPRNGDRVTAIVSALAAIAILGVGVTAQPSRSTVGDELARLESDLRFQIELSGRHDQGKFTAHTAMLEQVLAAWRVSPQSKEDRELMIGWLRNAIVRTLPAESGELPPAPKFSEAKTITRDKSAPRDDGKAPAATRETKKPSVAPAPGSPPKAVTNLTQDGESAASHADRPKNAAKAVPKPMAGTALPTARRPDDRAPAGNATAERSVTVRKPATSNNPTTAARQASPRKPQAVAVTPIASDAGVKKVDAPRPIPVRLNLAELNARVAGYHDGLDEIEATALALQETASTPKAVTLITQLEELATQHEFVLLYYNALTAEEREFVAEPRSIVETVRLVREQLEKLQPVSDGDFLESDESSRGALAKRLRAIGERAGK